MPQKPHRFENVSVKPFQVYLDACKLKCLLLAGVYLNFCSLKNFQCNLTNAQNQIQPRYFSL